MKIERRDLHADWFPVIFGRPELHELFGRESLCGRTKEENEIGE